MAYAPRQDGLNDVVLPDGTRVPSGLSTQQLEAMGHEPIPMPPPNPFAGLPPNAVAGPGGGPIALTLEQIEDLEAKGVYSPAQANQAKIDNGAFRAAPSRPDTNNGSSTDQIDRWVASGSITPARATQLKSEAGVADGQTAAQRAVPAPPKPLPEPAPKTAGAPSPAASAEGLIPISAAQAPAGPPGYPTQAPGRTYKIKGGDVRASFIRTPGVEVSDDVKSDLLNNDPEQADINAVQDYDDREAMRLERESHLQGQQQQLDQAAARRAKIDNTLQQKQQLIDQRDKEIDKLTPQSAREIWEDKGTLARVFGAMTIILGGALQGLQGRATNPGLDMLNGSIREEIDGQRAKYEAAQKKGQSVRNDYSQALALYGTPEAAALDLEMRRNALAATIIQSHGEQITNREKQQVAFQTADQLRQQRGELKQKLNELEHGKVLQENWVNVPDRYVTTGGPPKLTKEQREDSKDARKRIIRRANGEFGYVTDSNRVKDIQEPLTAGGIALSGIAHIRSLLPKGGGATLDPDARVAVKAAQLRVLNQISKLEGQGVVTKADADNSKESMADLDAIIANNASSLNATESMIKETMRSVERDNVYADPDATIPVASGRAQSFKPGL